MKFLPLISFSQSNSWLILGGDKWNDSSVEMKVNWAVWSTVVSMYCTVRKYCKIELTKLRNKFMQVWQYEFRYKRITKLINSACSFQSVTIANKWDWNSWLVSPPPNCLKTKLWLKPLLLLCDREKLSSSVVVFVIRSLVGKGIRAGVRQSNWRLVSSR